MGVRGDDDPPHQAHPIEPILAGVFTQMNQDPNVYPDLTATRHDPSGGLTGDSGDQIDVVVLAGSRRGADLALGHQCHADMTGCWVLRGSRL